MLFRCAMGGFCGEHDGRAVRVVGTDVTAVVAARALKTYPNIRLNLLEHMSEVQGCVGIG
jgi:hypothetical protein